MREILLTFIIFLSLNINSSFCQIKIDSVLFEHAVSAPRDLGKNIDELISYLLKVAKDEKDSLSVICYWIIDNIEYDLKGFHTKSYGDQSWFNTLLTRKAVCQGYSELVKEICDRIGMESHTISGFSKGYGYETVKTLNEPDHAWNIVKVDENYQLFDLTWASGGVSFDDSTKYLKGIKTKYLFAEPTRFVEKHLPSTQMWQLLNHPVSLKEFEAHASASKMIDSTSSFYNFTDSISAYLQLDEYDKEMKDVYDAYIFLPNEINCAHWYYKKGFEMSFGKYNEDRFKESIELLTLALATYQKPEFLYQPYVNSCLDSIRILEKRLKNKK